MQRVARSLSLISQNKIWQFHRSVRNDFSRKFSKLRISQNIRLFSSKCGWLILTFSSLSLPLADKIGMIRPYFDRCFFSAFGIKPDFFNWDDRVKLSPDVPHSYLIFFLFYAPRTVSVSLKSGKFSFRKTKNEGHAPNSCQFPLTALPFWERRKNEETVQLKLKTAMKWNDFSSFRLSYRENASVCVTQYQVKHIKHKSVLLWT